MVHDRSLRRREVGEVELLGVEVKEERVKGKHNSSESRLEGKGRGRFPSSISIHGSKSSEKGDE